MTLSQVPPSTSMFAWSIYTVCAAVKPVQTKSVIFATVRPISGLIYEVSVQQTQFVYHTRQFYIVTIHSNCLVLTLVSSPGWAT